MFLEEKEVTESIKQAEIALNMLMLVEEMKNFPQVTGCWTCDSSCTGKSDDDCNY